MSTAETNIAKEPLGVGRIISESFSVFFGNLVKIMLVGFVPTVIGLIISGSILGFGVALGVDQPAPEDVVGGAFWRDFGLSILAQLVIYSVTIALLVQVAFDAKLGKSRGIADYFGPAIRSILPLIVLGIVTYLAFTLGLMLLVIPGFWVLAVFFVVVPAIVIDQAGFGGMGRSMSLTKEYRWPIVGAFIIMFICTVLISVLAGFLLGLVGAAIGGAAGIIVSLILAGCLYAITNGLMGITIALVYARLREIKEGIGIDKIAEVFA